MIIAIDGPAGSGKSTIAKLVARSLGFSYLDTGAMYRSIAWLAAHEGVDVEDTEAMRGLVENAVISFGYTLGEELPSTVSVNGHDITAAIRTPEVDAMVSVISAIAEVREALVDQQRVIARVQDTVLEGRDIGTTVFPDAEVKVFLTASPEVRAHRRAAQNAERHGKTDLNQVYEALLERDRLDSERSCSPLVRAEDAVEVDTSEMSVEQVVYRICELVKGA